MLKTVAVSAESLEVAGFVVRVVAVQVVNIHLDDTLGHEPATSADSLSIAKVWPNPRLMGDDASPKDLLGTSMALNRDEWAANGTRSNPTVHVNLAESMAWLHLGTILEAASYL